MPKLSYSVGWSTTHERGALTMSRDTGEHDVKLCAIGVINLAKEFIVCNVPCEEIICEAVMIETLLTNHEENTVKACQNNGDESGRR